MMDLEGLLQGAANGDPISMEILAYMHESGKLEGDSNPRTAVSLYEKLANPPFESARAMLKLGMIYCLGKCESGSIGKPDFKLGREYIQKGYKHVDIENPMDISLCKDLGFFIGEGDASESGRSNSEDIKMSIKFLQKALQNEKALKTFAKESEEEAYVNNIRGYLKNREDLLVSEEELASASDGLKHAFAALGGSIKDEEN